MFKGLLLQGDNLVQLVVLCADKPGIPLLKRVAKELPLQLKKVSEEHKYVVSTSLPDGAVLVTDGTITVKVSLTSPLLRDSQGICSFYIYFYSFSVLKYFSSHYYVMRLKI